MLPVLGSSGLSPPASSRGHGWAGPGRRCDLHSEVNELLTHSTRVTVPVPQSQCTISAVAAESLRADSKQNYSTYKWV